MRRSFNNTPFFFSFFLLGLGVIVLTTDVLYFTLHFYPCLLLRTDETVLLDYKHVHGSTIKKNIFG